MVKVTDWDMAYGIQTKEDVVAFFEAALEENDAEFLCDVLGDIARSQGMAQIAQELLLSRDRPFSPDHPLFATVAKILDVLGLEFSLQQKKAS